MTDRERLIRLMQEASQNKSDYAGNIGLGQIADYLLEHGIIVPPCKVGDTYYTIQKYCNTDPFDTEKEPVMPWDCEFYCSRADCSFKEYRIDEHRFCTVSSILDAEKAIGKTKFLTREEAEQALKERENNG